MKTLIRDGLLIDPANRVQAKLNLLLEDGKVAAVTADCPPADEAIDAGNKIVCPGFIDIHMHEDPVGTDGKIELDDKTSIFHCMLRMGVTTVLGGNCGLNVYHPADYLDIVDRDGAPVNVAMLAGHAFFREAVGCTNKYEHATRSQKQRMTEDMQAALDRGCVGISYGIRYVPGLDIDEMTTTAAACRKDNKMIAAHIRDDADGVIDAAKELLETGRTLNLPVEVSHIGSMAGFGQMERFMNLIDTYRMNGLDVSCDCYPYYAFSTHLGSTVYDEGWLDRYHCGYDVVELCSGKYKGQRCTKEIFDEMRREDPMCLTVCYVMKPEDVDLAFRHPNVMLASDGLFDHGQGHPRAAGAFARLLSKFACTGKISLYDAVSKMTAMPAEKLRLSNKGRLNVGADADVVVFDPKTICDNATFDQPALAPTGIDYVLIGGEVAAKNGVVCAKTLGRAIRK